MRAITSYSKAFTLDSRHSMLNLMGLQATHDCCGPVTIMNIEIDDGNSRNLVTVVVLGVGCTDGDRIQQAEACG